jgi:hypothetical protein
MSKDINEIKSLIMNFERIGIGRTHIAVIIMLVSAMEACQQDMDYKNSNLTKLQPNIYMKG